MRSFTKYITIAVVLSLLLSLCPAVQATGDAHTILLESSGNGTEYTHRAFLDGKQVKEYDYVWHADPSGDYGQVKNSPAEYYTGQEPTGDDMVYISHDIFYYPQLEQSKFTQVRYDGETEWVYMYEAPGYEDYIFSTLPVLSSGFPSWMMHSPQEAYSNGVLTITEPGTYRLEGSWHGQVRVDLGDDAFDNPQARVKLVLAGVDIRCTVAPGVVFANVYECDNGWEDRTDYGPYVDTTQAGANVVLADGTENHVSGTNIYRILKTQFKDEDSSDPHPAQKKRLKTDGAFYSYMSMNILGQAQGSGVLNIESEFEGLNSELHLTILGGNIHIQADNDGINVNEDDVSVLTVRDGSIRIVGGLGDEGDGIDSNGYILVTGGTLVASANPAADSGMDSDRGSYVTGGTVVALGSSMDWAQSDETYGAQPVLNLRFARSRSLSEPIIITDAQDELLFAFSPETLGERSYSGAIICAPALEQGTQCRLYLGGTVNGLTDTGVYDASGVSDYTLGKLQCWSGTEMGGFGPGGMGEDRPDPGEQPLDGQIPERGERPEDGGMNGGGFPEGQMPGGESMPEGGFPGGGMSGGEKSDGDVPGGEKPEGDFPGNGNRPGGMPWPGTEAGATCGYETVFSLAQRVNVFGSVSDYRHALLAREDGRGYECSACSARFADEQGTVPYEINTDSTGIIILAAGIALAVVAATAIAMVIAGKKRKARK